MGRTLREGIMTYGVKTIAGVVSAQKKQGFLGTDKPLFGARWAEIKLGGWCPMTRLSWTLDDIYTYVIGAHMGHLTEFIVAVTCWLYFFADGTWLEECQEWQWSGWVARVLAFNLACEVIFVGFWHWLVYVSRFAQSMVPFKFNPDNQYEKTGQVGFVTSSSGQLQREVVFTTLGWLQSGLWQAVMMWLWASKRLPVYTSFWEYPQYSVLPVCDHLLERDTSIGATEACTHGGIAAWA